MKISRTARRRLIPAGAVVAPIVLLQLVRSLLSTGPAAAPAANYVPPTVAPDTGAPKPQAVKLTPEQEKALAWLKDTAARTAMRSPMDFRAPAAIIEVHVLPDREPVPTPAVTPAADPLPVPRLSLTTILKRQDGALAAINGKIYHVGDEVATGWKVTKIDRDDWAVTVTCEDGRTIEVGSYKKR